MPSVITSRAEKISTIEVPSPCTPAEAFKRLAGDGVFFLDSALQMGEDRARYSFLGSRPFMVLKSKGNNISIRDRNGTTEKKGNPFEELRGLLNRFRYEGFFDIPFTGGAVGYLSYDLCHFIERLPSTTVDDMGFPEMYFAFYDRVIVYDHYLKKCLLVGRNTGDDLNDIVSATPKTGPVPVTGAQSSGRADKPVIRRNFTKEAYLEAVRRVKEYIAQGDIYQVNLSQRFETDLTVSPHELYLRLRAASPAPFSSYIEFEDKAVVSSSPERFLRLSSGRVQTRPIKGTRPRGRDAASDASLMAELINSPKDNAELTMIVDLERNDIGRVCNYGSVRVTGKNTLETYPTVFHLAATVEGDLHSRYDAVDLIKATFPGGSITGAPKIRAMEIIDELEPTRRSVYTGAIGYIGFNGNMDLNIAIRSFLVKKGRAWFQAGGGIVADSDPEAEYQETLHKARALMESVA